MALLVGTIIEMTRDAPCYDVLKGDIGVIKEVCNNKEYLIHVYDKNKSFFFAPNYVKEYKYKEGDRIEIINPKSKYKGCHGTVVYNECVYDNYIALYVDGTMYCPGYFNKYLKLVKSSIRLVDIDNENKKGEIIMKLSGFNHVAVIEIAGNDYHYALYDESIAVGDKVLVTGRMATDILVVKNIITADEARENFTKSISDEVKCKIDLSVYEQRVKNRKEAEKLRKKMDEEIKKMDELNKYEMYADRNPALKEMLEQLKTLGV